MKHSLFLTILIMLFNFTNINTAQKEGLSNKTSIISWCYHYYDAIKEIFNAYNIIDKIDRKKNNQAQIACCACGSIRICHSLWCYLMVHFQGPLLKKLMNLVYLVDQNEKSIEELSILLLTTYQELQIECPGCHFYHGYYIPEQKPSLENQSK